MLVSWNVNGLRACVNKGFVDFFKDVNADIFCLQETKMQEDQSNDIIKDTLRDYHIFWNSADKKGYSGTLVASKTMPIKVSMGMGIDVHDHEGRVISLEFPSFVLINVYTPNSKDGLSRLPYRMNWEDDFRNFAHSFKKPVIICGDLNVAHKEIDLKNPKTNTKNAGFTKEEREKFSTLLDSGFIDTFRHFYPEKEDAYTWWSYKSFARDRNVGWRIDYFLAQDSLKDKLSNAYIYDDVYGSDHCPVGLNI